MKRCWLAVLGAALSINAFAQSAKTIPDDEVAPRPLLERTVYPAERIFRPRSADLTDEGVKSLSQLAAKARAIDLEVMIVVDYGELSAPRASAIQRFLVSAGIARNRIYTEGQAKPGRPRIEVEVIGSR